MKFKGNQSMINPTNYINHQRNRKEEENQKYDKGE